MMIGGVVAINLAFSQKYWECLIIAIDEIIFFRGVAQPPTSLMYIQGAMIHEPMRQNILGFFKDIYGIELGQPTDSLVFHQSIWGIRMRI